MLKKLLLSIILVFVLLSTFVVAEDVQKKYDLEVPFGKSAELNFNGYSEQTLLIREGSVVYFNVGELKNTFIIQELTQDSIKGKLSLMSGPFEDFELLNEITKETEIKLTKKIPFILIQYKLFTPGETAEDTSALLKFRFPFVTDLSDLSEVPVGAKIIETPQIAQDDSDLTLKILLIVVIVLLIIAILAGPKVLKKKAKK